jgi:hypothetical protein
VLTAERPSTTPHLGATTGLQACLPTGYGGGDQQQTPRRRAGAPASQAETDRAARGRTHLGRRTEAMSTNGGKIARFHSQKREREEAKRMPHTTAAETAGARRNRAARSSAIRNHQRGEGIRVSTSDRVRERGGSRLGRAGPVKPTRVDLTSGPRLLAASICFN